MELGLKGKIVLIGGASRGIGFAIASAFAAEGARVALVARDEEALGRAWGEIGGEAIAIAADLSTEEGSTHAVAGCVDAFGAIDAVVANAGSGTQQGGWDVDRAGWDASLEANLFTSMFLARASLPSLAGRDGASVTFVSSVAGRESFGAPLVYTAAKAALDASVKALARLAAPDGIRVNSVVPGHVLFPGGAWDAIRANDPEGVDRRIRADVPLERFGEPSEIADAVLFLASERASFITGAALVVDGGLTRGW